MIKKALPLVASILFAIAVLLSSLLLVDRQAPTISINKKPELSCKITEEDFLDNASVRDDNIKDFFIEENNLLEIADSEEVTFVALDKNNNVAKVKSEVDVDEDVSTYHIEEIKPLKLQINTNLVTSDYFVLKNGCGWEIDDTFSVTGYSNKTEGEYDVVVSSRKHQSQDYATTLIVGDFLSPKIYLNVDSLENVTGRYWSDNYFLELIDHIEDDNDNPEELMKKVKTNWKLIMNPDSNGAVNSAGTYTVTYTVTDSEGHIGKTTLKVHLTTYVPPAVEGE